MSIALEFLLLTNKLLVPLETRIDNASKYYIPSNYSDLSFSQKGEIWNGFVYFIHNLKSEYISIQNEEELLSFKVVERDLNNYSILRGRVKNLFEDIVRSHNFNGNMRLDR